MQPSQNEMTDARQWVQSNMPAGGDIYVGDRRAQAGRAAGPRAPFSFIYNGRSSGDLLPEWTRECSAHDLDGQRVERVLQYNDPRTGLQIRSVAVEYRAFPAVEWTLSFRNNGRSDTPILQQIQALDTVLACPKGRCTLHYSRGSVTYVDDYAPVDRALNTPKSEIYLVAGGGRSSSEHLPFFNLELSGEGVVVGLGWTGEWGARFTREGDRVHLRAGMDLTHFKLHAGEEVRSPQVLLIFWKDDRMRGHNLLRQFILTHHCPQVDGKPLVVPILSAGWGATPAAIHLANVQQMISHHLPVSYYWIDAEWHGRTPWWQNVGNWEIRRDVFPEGFKPISELLHNSGRKFMLWFEPYRVARGTPWYLDHREWLLTVKKEDACWSWPHWVDFDDPKWTECESHRNQIADGDTLLNIGIPEARQFLTDFLSRMIEESGIDCYREDCNIAPLKFWRSADPPDRQGITEIRWVEGLYKVWDELLRRHPGLIIDNCSSGSRRIDLETLSRATPFYRTDYTNDPIAHQCHSYGILHWIPINATARLNVGKDDKYLFRSAMSGSLIAFFTYEGDEPSQAAIPSDFPFSVAKRELDQYVGLQKYYYGDYFPLTEYTQAHDAWMVYQLDRPDLREGLVVALKRPSSAYEDGSFRLHELDTAGQYEITNLDTEEHMMVSGKVLTATGLRIHLANQPDSALFRYRRMNG